MVTLGVFCSTIKKKNILKTICKLFLLLVLTFFISCRENNKLEIIRDLHHFEPPHRNDKIINNFLTFSFSAQYFVFGYNKNKENFDSVLVKMVCNKINENVKDILFITRIDINFKDSGKYSTYNEGDILSADFKKSIVSVIWEIDEPNILNTKWGEEHTQKIIPFECLLSPEYDKILHKKE